MTCKECAHWKAADHFRASTGFGTCKSLRFHAGYREYNPPDAEPLPLTDVQVEADEGWGFFTGPDFGCVHFERTS